MIEVEARQPITYSFHYIAHCNMCGNRTDHHKVLGQRLNQSQGFNPRKKHGVTTSIMKCTNCDLIYANPLPIPANFQDHYGIPAEGYWKPQYFTYTPEYFSYEIGLAKKLLNFSEGMRALDIGAGIGKCMISLQSAGFDTYGFEPSAPFREKAVSEMKIDPKRLKPGKIEEVEYESEYFDFITFGAVLEHLYHPSQAIEKAMKWLKPGGIMQIEVPSSRHLIPKIMNSYFKMIGTNYVTNLSPMHEPYHLYEFDYRSFDFHSKRVGYEIAFHEYYVCSIYHLPEFLHPLLRWYMKKTGTGMQLTVWLRKKE